MKVKRNYRLNVFFLFLTVTVLTLLTFCRKVSRKNPELRGIWRTPSLNTGCRTFLEIQKNDRGEYGSAGNVDGCGHSFKGKARVAGNTLYIGNTKLKIIEGPAELNDSLYDLESSYVKTRVYAKMVIKTTVLHSSATYTLFKVRE